MFHQFIHNTVLFIIHDSNNLVLKTRELYVYKSFSGNINNYKASRLVGVSIYKENTAGNCELCRSRVSTVQKDAPEKHFTYIQLKYMFELYKENAVFILNLNTPKFEYQTILFITLNTYISLSYY